jgi:8-oxo-dGTP pyrophosphatase MutT (NUDIX family)
VPPDSAVLVPQPASTVLVLRDSAAGPEVFMVRRHEGTAFMGGAHVFPGGRVDAGDRETAEHA